MKRRLLWFLAFGSMILIGATNSQGQDTSACRQLGVDCSHPPQPKPPQPLPHPIDRGEKQREQQRQKEEADRRRKISDETQLGQAALDRGDARAAAYHCAQALQLDPKNAQGLACANRAKTMLADQQSAAQMRSIQREFDNRIAKDKSEAQVRRLQDASTASELFSFSSDFDRNLTILHGDARGRLSASELITVFNHANEKGWKPDPDSEAQPFPKGGMHNVNGGTFRPGDEHLSAMCSQYFRETMREFSKQGFKVPPEWTDEDCNANCIITRIKRSSDSADGQWIRIGSGKVQESADRGVLVVGVSFYPEGPGHIAAAFPNAARARLSQINGEGPLIRDGNEHPPEKQADHRLYASTWGAIKSSKAFSSSRPPTWYVWMPSVQ